MSVSFKKTGNIIADGNPNFNLMLNTPGSYSPNLYGPYKINLSENLVKGATYTVQFWNVNISNTSKTADTIGFNLYWGGGNIKIASFVGTDYITNGHADYIVGTFTTQTSSHSTMNNPWIMIYHTSPNEGTKNMYIERWKLEKGSIPTVYTMGEDISVGNSGFVEYDDITKIQKNGFIQSIEFNEY